MQYSYTQSCSLLRTVDNETERLRTQFIHVSVKNRANTVASANVLTECETWANAIKNIHGTGISYDNDEEINFSRVTSSLVRSETDTVNITFICRRIEGSKPEFLQFTIINATTTGIYTSFVSTLYDMTGGDNDSINNYIIVNAIIDM